MIEIKHLRKEYETVTPIEDLSVTINDGDIISIIGPSGTGKSTLLRMINMLEKPTSGQIFIDGEDITVPGFQLSKIRGKIVMVFQSFNLFNNMTVLENVCVGQIKLKGIKPSDAYEKSMKLLEEVGLGGFAFSYPAQLSGGQKQRAAIARAIAMDPEVILFDEPTSALDPTMTGEIELIIKRLAANKKYTMLLVTHDMSFAESVANRVFYLDEGGIYEDGTPDQIFNNQLKEKTKAFVKQYKSFTGEINKSDSDFMNLYSELSKFTYKSEMSREMDNHIKAIFEELCFQIVVNNIKDENKRILFNLGYSQVDKIATFTLEFAETSINLESEQNAMSWNIIKHYADDIHISNNDGLTVIKITIKDK